MVCSCDSIFTPPPSSAAGSVVFGAVGKLEKETPVVAQNHTQPAIPKPLPEAASDALPARGCLHASALVRKALPPPPPSTAAHRLGKHFQHCPPHFWGTPCLGTPSSLCHPTSETRRDLQGPTSQTAACSSPETNFPPCDTRGLLCFGEVLPIISSVDAFSSLPLQRRRLRSRSRAPSSVTAAQRGKPG